MQGSTYLSGIAFHLTCKLCMLSFEIGARDSSHVFVHCHLKWLCSSIGIWADIFNWADILFLYRLLIQICCSSWLRTLLRACSCCNNDVDMWTATLKLSTEQCPHDWGSYLLLTAISSNSWQGGVCGSPCHRQSRPQTLIEPRHYRFTEVKSESFVMMRRQNWTKASLCVNWAGLTC